MERSRHWQRIGSVPNSEEDRKGERSHSDCSAHTSVAVVAVVVAVAAIEAAAADVGTVLVKAWWLFLVKLVVTVVVAVLVVDLAYRRSCLCFRNTWWKCVMGGCLICCRRSSRGCRLGSIGVLDH